jgi:small subunit ribosomal protein S1
MKRIVTVDGPAGSGKSTIAKLLANRIGYTYLDTGSLYRAVTYYFLKNKIAAKDNYKIAHAFSDLKVNLKKEQVLLNGEDISAHLRTEEITKNVATYAQSSEIRKYIRLIQTKIGENGQCVVDGRDIGTVVFPDAFCKFYLDASAAVRAQRRLKDEKEGGSPKTEEEIEQDILKRDQQDTSRPVSPLKIPIDALTIDSSEMDIDQVMERMITFYNKKIGQLNDPAHIMQTDDSKMFLSALENITIDDEEKEVGSLIKGTIIKLTNKEIMLDINDKRDGVIPQEEVVKIDKSSLKVGDVIDVFLLNANTTSSQIVVSKFEADKRSALIKVKEAFENKDIVEGEVTNIVKGGFLVDIQGNAAFCPYSEFDIRKVNKTKQIGLKDKFHIIEFKNQKIVVSRKKFLEDKYRDVRENFFNNVREGDILEGTVVNVTDFGIFVEVEEAITAIIRPKNVSWKRYETLTSVVDKGDVVKGKVIKIIPEKFKLELSKKDLEKDPLEDFEQGFKPGDVIKGEVKNIESFGAFIEVAEGLEGLVHVSEMSWTKRINHPADILKVGDFVETKLLSIDMAKRKISLGLKQVVANPWDTIEQRYPEGEVVQATVKSIIKNGIYCDVDSEFEGFVHIEDISWTTDRINPKNMFKEGETIEAKVLGFTKSKRRIELGLKQKTSNPWNDLRVNYGEGGVINAEVTKLIDTGAFVKLSEEIEGFCHISQVPLQKDQTFEDAVKPGEKCHFYIQAIDEVNKKVSLSIKEYIKHQNRKDVEKYIEDSDKVKTVTIADLLKES